MAQSGISKPQRIKKKLPAAQINYKGRSTYIVEVASDRARAEFKRVGVLVRTRPDLQQGDLKACARKLNAIYTEVRKRLTEAGSMTEEEADFKAACRVVDSFEADWPGSLESVTGASAPVGSVELGATADFAQLPAPVGSFGVETAAEPAQLALEVSTESCSKGAVREPQPLVWIWQLCDQQWDVGTAEALRASVCDGIARYLAAWNFPAIDLERIVVKRALAVERSSMPVPSYGVLAMSVGSAYDEAWRNLLQLEIAMGAKLFGVSDGTYQSWVHVRLFTDATSEHYCGWGAQPSASPHAEPFGFQGAVAPFLAVGDANPWASGEGGHASVGDAPPFADDGDAGDGCSAPLAAGGIAMEDEADEFRTLEETWMSDELKSFVAEGSSGDAPSAQRTQPPTSPDSVARSRIKVALMVENDDYLTYTRDELPKLPSDLAGTWNAGDFFVDVLECHSMDPDPMNAALTVAIGLPAADGPQLNFAAAIDSPMRELVGEGLTRPVSEAELEVLHHCEGCVIVLLEMPALMARVLTALVELGHRQMVDELKVSCAALIEGDHLGPLAVATFFGGGPDKAVRARKEEELVGAWHKWTQAQAAADAGKNARVGAEAAGQAAGADGVSAAAGAAPAVCAAGEALAEAPIVASSSAALGVAAGDAVAGSKAPQAGGGFAGAKPAGSKALRRAELGQAQAGGKGPKQAPSSSATPFSVFRAEQYPALKRSNPGMTAAQLNERLGADWLSMPDSDKVYYKDKAKEAK